MPKRIVTDVLWIKGDHGAAIPVAFIKTGLTIQGICPWCGSNVDPSFTLPADSTIGVLVLVLFRITSEHIPLCSCGYKTDPFNDLNVITEHLN